jgi:hypothetical protein
MATTEIEHPTADRVEAVLDAEGTLGEALLIIAERIDEIEARQKKTNSLCGMISGRLPAPRRK